MGKFWLKVWIWTKVVFFFLIFLYVLTFAIKNDKDATIWVSFNKEIQTSTLVLAIVAFCAGGICALLIRTVLVTMRQFREVKERNRQEQMQRDIEVMKAAASSMQDKSPGDSATKT